MRVLLFPPEGIMFLLNDFEVLLRKLRLRKKVIFLTLFLVRGHDLGKGDHGKWMMPKYGLWVPGWPVG